MSAQLGVDLDAWKAANARDVWQVGLVIVADSTDDCIKHLGRLLGHTANVNRSCALLEKAHVYLSRQLALCRF